MSAAKKGDFVHVHYTGSLQDGTVFDSSRDKDPLVFQLGKGLVVPGFETAVTGMAVGETRTATVPAAQAYGPRLSQLTFTVPRENLPAGYDPRVGEVMRMEYRDGRQMDAVISHADEGFVKMDANHPLAGKDLTFEIELVRIG